jgi:hypothetical protein
VAGREWTQTTVHIVHIVHIVQPGGAAMDGVDGVDGDSQDCSSDAAEWLDGKGDAYEGEWCTPQRWLAISTSRPAGLFARGASLYRFLAGPRQELREGHNFDFRRIRLLENK